jgi:hypothetical protein
MAADTHASRPIAPGLEHFARDYFAAHDDWKKSGATSTAIAVYFGKP